MSLMKDAQSPRNGIIPCENQKSAAFFVDNYLLFVLPTEIENPPSATVYAARKDGFLYGVTHQKKVIAIYLGNAHSYLAFSYGFGIPAYFLGTALSDSIPHESKTFFDGISFEGGTLGKVFVPQSMRVNHDTAVDGILINYSDDALTYRFKDKQCSCTVVVRSLAQFEEGLNGTFIGNAPVSLELLFDTPQPFSSFFRHYNNIRTLLSFMTFRGQISFDEIHLLNKSGKPHIGHEKTWDVFINDKADTSQKHPMRTITFGDLGDCTGKFLEMIYGCTDKKASYSMGFIPDNDAVALIISNDTVKAICSALECEISFAPPINTAEDSSLSELKAKICALLSEFQQGERPLQDKTRDKILGSMTHWDMSLADQVTFLFHQHEECLRAFAKNSQGELCSDDDIAAFVKYRNDITHGRYRTITKQIANTAYMLEALVYCCLLTRLDMDKSKLIELCKFKIAN